MVGIVNPSGNKTLDDYKERAGKLAKAVTPGKAAFGGELVDKDSSTDGKDGKDDKKGDKDGKDDKDDKDNSAGMLQISTAALAGAFGAALYML